MESVRRVRNHANRKLPELTKRLAEVGGALLPAGPFTWGLAKRVGVLWLLLLPPSAAISSAQPCSASTQNDNRFTVRAAAEAVLAMSAAIAAGPPGSADAREGWRLAGSQLEQVVNYGMLMGISGDQGCITCDPNQAPGAPPPGWPPACGGAQPFTLKGVAMALANCTDADGLRDQGIYDTIASRERDPRCGASQACGSAPRGCQKCENGGVLTGTGGDHAIHNARFTGCGIICPASPYTFERRPFTHFTLNSATWPNAGFGLEVGKWSVACGGELSVRLGCIVCPRGARVHGIGGDNKSYSADFPPGEVCAEPRYTFAGRPFSHFTSNGSPHPDTGWGLEVGRFEMSCK